jgi:hypothetical protein
MRRRRVGALARAVDVEITPEPTEDERRAIFEALEKEGAAAAAPSAWRRAGLGPGPEDEADQAVAPPRQRRGATRA